MTMSLPAEAIAATARWRNSWRFGAFDEVAHGFQVATGRASVG